MVFDYFVSYCVEDEVPYNNQCNKKWFLSATPIQAKKVTITVIPGNEEN